MDGLRRAGKPCRVLGVLALVLAMLFGASIGAPTSRAGITHQLLSPDHHAHGSWSGGDGGQQQPLILHAEGEQVETPDASGHALAQLTTGTGAQLAPVPLAEPAADGAADHAPDRCMLQIWRT
ncbi:hypothetical protein Daura_11240 [Dactylosporangium aurantiacum]|uniref:Uncharacterized protein n=1 Tax=Dactylosporangium aurantiacum TaxID=35754 RepID=A0A9Q9IMG6_9ACTN|nr:hypothetical protein [Dactylosporangium aurantiacum]MDG6104318.1 hypothetical protein [Dactylosporangium aurantiacum]UWZ56690.1 hypothetical protein Daura_11240 [Dactylosporangium aurantiacum]